MQTNTNQVEILVLDFGSQYTQLIARRLREYGIYTEIVPYFEKLDSIQAKNPKGIILSGGPASVYEEDAYKPDSRIFELHIPILGICYGMQYIAHFFGGSVVRAEAQEFGKAVLEILNADARGDIVVGDNVRHGIIMENENIRIQEFVPNDLQALESMLLDSEVMNAWGRALSKDEAKEWLNTQILSYSKHGFGLWAIIDKSSNEIVGQCGISMQNADQIHEIIQKSITQGDYLNQERASSVKNMLDIKAPYVPELGYIFKKSHWHKGLASAAAKMCMEYAFKDLGLPFLMSFIKVDNLAAQNLAKRLEMQIVGRVEREFDLVQMTHFAYMIRASDYALLNMNESKKRFDFEILNGNLDSKDRDEIVKIWRDSVNATHHFLSQNDIANMQSYMENMLSSLQIIIASSNGKRLGFIGSRANKIEALFVSPSAFKKGVGMSLMLKALESGLCDYSEILLDCNEQNVDSIKFYNALGFTIYARSSKDNQGNDFPLVHFKASNLELIKKFGIHCTLPLFESERLIVRELRESDLFSLQNMLTDYEVMSSWEYNFSDSSAREWLDKEIEKYKKFGFGLWAVVEKSSGEVIGQVGLSTQNYNNKQVLGMTYIIDRAHWHKGYGLEVARACKDYAFYHLDISMIYLLIKEHNEAAKTIANKLNATMLGETTWSYRGREMQRIVYRIKNTNKRGFRIETNRTILRQYQEGDFESLQEILQDRETMQENGGALSNSEVDSWIQAQQESYATYGIGTWVIEDKLSRKIIGQAGINTGEYLEINYILHKSHWHKGYGIEVARACKEYAFKHLRAKEIYCICREDNKASQNVALRIGMQKVGEEIRDSKLYYKFGAISRIKPSHVAKYTFSLSHNAKLEQIRLEDIKSIGDILATWSDYFTQTHANLPKQDIETSIRVMHNLFKEARHCLSLNDNNEVLGFALVLDDDVFELFLTSTNASLHKEGALLLGGILPFMNKECIYTPLLDASTKAKSFYEGLGFSMSEEHKALSHYSNFPYHTYMINKAILSKILESFSYPKDSKKSNKQYDIFGGIKQNSIVWMSHADKVEKIPQGFVELAKSGNTQNCAIADFERQIYALQFHPEVVHSECGGEILRNFAVGICGADTSWNMKNFAESEIAKLREKVLGATLESLALCKSHKEALDTHHIDFRAITDDNFHAVCNLKVLTSQQCFIESNLDSINEAKKVGYWQTRAIYSGIELVGFVMYDYVKSEDRVWIDRFMIDGRFSNQGLGTLAFGMLIERLFSEFGKDYIYISVYEENTIATRFYHKLGFISNGERDRNDEAVMVLSRDIWESKKGQFLGDSGECCTDLAQKTTQGKTQEGRLDVSAAESLGDFVDCQGGGGLDCVQSDRLGRSILDEKLPQRDSANEAYRDIRRSEAEVRRGDLSLKDKPFSKVLCAVSGGVDSSVVATLLYRAIGEHLIPVFVDTGLLRKNEREAVEKMFKENLKVPLIVVDAKELFLGRLKGVIDPEKKRKIIGETFIEVFEAEAKKHNINGEIKFLAQGTLYPDVIESVSVKGPSKTIKSHHNVGGLPEWMKFELIEPLRELFKDEVRALGRELGMPESMLMRHPFPGPGLAIRIMGEVNEADLALLKEADSIFIEELHRAGLYDSVWQAFCVLLNVRSVGVMGDNRTYDNTICVRAVDAADGMTASFSHLPHEFLESVANRIINEVEGINRVVYDITSKPPGTIEWE